MCSQVFGIPAVGVWAPVFSETIVSGMNIHTVGLFRVKLKHIFLQLETLTETSSLRLVSEAAQKRELTDSLLTGHSLFTLLRSDK